MDIQGYTWGYSINYYVLSYILWFVQFTKYSHKCLLTGHRLTTTCCTGPTPIKAGGVPAVGILFDGPASSSTPSLKLKTAHSRPKTPRRVNTSVSHTPPRPSTPASELYSYVIYDGCEIQPCTLLTPFSVPM